MEALNHGQDVSAYLAGFTPGKDGTPQRTGKPSKRTGSPGKTFASTGNSMGSEPRQMRQPQFDAAASFQSNGAAQQIDEA